MTLKEFRESLIGPAPPSGLPAVLVALWHDAKGDWEAAHRVAQEVADESGSWVHAYLHRKEGDTANAAYWYRHAGRSPARGPLDAEWEEIVSELLARP